MLRVFERVLSSRRESEVIVECRRCGTGAPPDACECADCGSGELARYEI